MNRFLALSLFTIIHFGLFAQCGIQITNSNYCIGSTNNAFIHLLNNESDNPESLIWSVSPSLGVDDGVLSGTNNEEYYITFNNPGTYTVTMSASDCPESSIEVVIFPLTTIETNVVEEYTLCNGNLLVDFEILNPQNFNLYQWSNINVGDNIIEYTTAPSFNVEFNNPENFTFVVSTTDLNGCISVKDLDITINDGPTLDEIQISVNNQTSDCVDPGSDYVIDLSVISSFQIESFTPTSYNVNVSETLLSEEFFIPITISYNSGCSLLETFTYSHNINLEPSFTTDFDGVLCNNETITLVNNSPHLNTNTEDDFSWDIPEANIISQTANQITFNYTEDGDYSWVLNYDDENCSTSFSETHNVDVDFIEPEYSFNSTNFCESPADVQLTNTTNSGDNTYSYNWILNNAISNTSSTSTEENPNFSITEIGSWDLNVNITSSSGCSLNYLDEEVLSLVGEPSFTTDFDGVLCNNETITLINTSPHLSANTQSYFSWTGIPTENIISETALEITFTYFEDGGYDWTLNYNDGICNTTYTEAHAVNVDLIVPTLSSEINQMSCSFNSSLELIDATELDETQTNYDYQWNIIPSIPSSDSTEPLTSTDYNPTFNIQSAEAQSYTVELQISNAESACSTSQTFVDFYTIGGIIIESNQEEISFCDQGTINTNTIIESQFVSQYNYLWTLFYEGEEINTLSGYTSIFSFEEPGNYSINLVVNDSECSSDEVSTPITIYESPSIENIFNDIVLCNTPTDTSITIISTNTSLGNSNYLWVLEDSETGEFTTNNGEVFNHTFTNNGAYYLSIAIENDLSLCNIESGFTIYIEDVNAEITANLTDLCSPGQVILSTSQNPFINSLEWNLYNNETLVDESSNYTFSPYLESGLYDVELITATNNGCVNTEIAEDYIQVNNFEVTIEPAPTAICLNDQNSIEQSFSSTISPEEENLTYSINNYNWSITSSNSSSTSLNNSTENTASFNFTEAGSYTLEYTVWINADEDCVYTETINFNVGLTSNIISNDIICVGENFEVSVDTDNWSNSHIFQWNSNSELIIESPNSETTNINSNSTIPIGTVTENNLSVLVTNDVGCWTSDEVNFQVYDIAADFTVADSILNCTSEELILNSINNDFINSWTWTISENSPNTTNQPNFNTVLSETGYSSVNLSISSIHGCSSELFKDSVVLVNAFDVDIVTDSVFCFNGANTLENTFISEISALYDTDYTIVNPNWTLSPTTGVNSNTSTTNPDSISYTFTTPNTYDLQYSFGVGSSICTVNKSISFDVGVSAQIIQPSTICTGNNFTAISLVDNWSESHQYSWNTTSDLLIETPNSSNTVISTSSPLEANSTDNFDLSLTVTNEVGCWDTYTAEIEIYEVIANFTISDSILHCNPQETNVLSTNNNYINSWEWTFSAEQGNETFESSDPNFTGVITNQGFTDITLSIDSEHGCEDTFTIENAILLNNYNLVIEEQLEPICFNGLGEISQSFTSSINPIFTGYDYEVTNYTWNVLTDNGGATNIIYSELDSVHIEFSESGHYKLAWGVWIDGTSNSECFYTDTISFNVGIDANINVDPIMCVGELFNANSSIDTWSQEVEYSWESIDPIIFGNSTTSNTTFSSDSSIGSNLTEYYNLSLTTTNDQGCWETKTTSVEVYQVHADFLVSDSVLHCNPQDVTLTSLHNNYINSWEWLFSAEQGTDTYQGNSQVFTQAITNQGSTNITLDISSVHGCNASYTIEDAVLLNNYNVEINDVPSSICLNGEDEINQSFTSFISPIFEGYPFEVLNHTWEVTSSNNQNTSIVYDNLDSVQIQFNTAGVYELTYTVWIDGTNTDCIYSDNVSFNVGIDATISVDPIICVGELFNANSSIDTWSQEVEYSWESIDPIIFGNSTTSNTTFSSDSSIGSNLTEYYNLSLTTTNDQGCWETETTSVEVYQVHADFTTSDSILHCTPQDAVLSSLNNNYITEYLWTVQETENLTTINLNTPSYTHTFTDGGYSDLSLQVSSQHGCTDQQTYTNAILLNDYTVSIEEVPNSICLNGASDVTQNFYSEISPQFTGLPYEVDNYNWSIISANANNATQINTSLNSVEYSFNEAGTYELVYSIWIDGSFSDCLYSDTVSFNVGVNSNINYDNLICIGGVFTANAEVDLWSNSHEYLWTSTDNLVLVSPNSQETNFTSSSNIGENATEYYDLNLLVTNDVGCWESNTVEIEAYEVIADFELSDTLLHCSNQEVLLSSLNNEHIINYDWTINESTTTHNFTTENSNYLYTFGDIGYSDITLEITSEQGCTDELTIDNQVLLNDYTALITPVPTNICFNGESVITQTFISTINALYQDLPYTIESFNWEITSIDNNSTILLNSTSSSANYSFTNSGAYSLVYSVWIAGTNTNCLYTDTTTFNIGVHTDLIVDEIICVGELFNASASSDYWSSSLDFIWSSNGDVIIGNPTSATTTISTENNIDANVTESYELNLMVTNDQGCWETQTETIQAYQVIAEYTSSDYLLFCSPQELYLESNNNQYIYNWNWDVNTSNGQTFEATTQNTNFSLSEIAVYNIELQIESIHGCTDQIEVPAAVVLNDLDPQIENLDSVNCYNGETEIIKSFGVILNPSLAYSPEIINFNWTISPNVVVLSESVSEIEFLFTESDNYTLNYTVEVANGNGTSCVYSNEMEFSIGVNSSISIPSVICQGIPFEIEADVSIGIGTETTYNWSSTNDIIFSNPTGLNGTIESFGAITGDDMEQYTIDFIVSNENGCWESQTQNINTYSAVADFTSSDEGEICAPVVLNFNSLYTNNISSYEWSYQGINYLGETLNYIYPEDSILYGDYFNQMAVYDITLSVISIDGCTDTLTKTELLDIKRPYPYFVLENEIICDEEQIDIIDSSNYSTNVGLFTQNVFYDSTYYQINDTTSITYNFPYDISEDLYYNYPVTLNAFLGQCSGQYTDTMTVLPVPQIDVIISDSIGCPPFTVEFTENSTYIIPENSIYYWDFGDETSDTTQNPTHIYTEPGIYSIYHSVISENGCFSDSVLLTEIEIFDYPVADFDYNATTFCHGLGDLQLINTSIYITDTINCNWIFGLDSVVESTLFDPLIHFEGTNDFYVNLEITDLHGCVDDTTKLIEVIVLDTIVSQPILNYVSTEEINVFIEWATEQDEKFDSMSLLHSLDGVFWNTIFTTNDLNQNYYTHDIETNNQVNIYGLIQQDSCGYSSDISILHSTILLNATSTEFQEVNLNWTPYIGWDTILNYQVNRFSVSEGLEVIAVLNSDRLNYTDINLCNVSYQYYITAEGINFNSNSNTVDITPQFIDFTIPFEIDYTTIYQNESILTEWTELHESFMSYYNIDRWDTYFGWVEDFTQIQAPPYIDQEVGIFHRNYVYRIHYQDDCGNTGPLSNIGTNILLSGEQYASHYVLDWSAYQSWNNGVQYYSLEYLNEDSQEFIEIETFDSSTYTYTDTDLDKEGVKTEYCYRIVAYSNDNNKYSISNNRCFIPAPKVYFPNAFSPNNDQLNDTYFFKGVFAQSLTISIYDRWGTEVFTSTDVDFHWDGIHLKNEAICPQGTYTLDYDIVGVNGSNYSGLVTIYLLR